MYKTNMKSFSDIFEKICRICGKLCRDKMVSLFEDDTGSLSCFGKAISTFANVTISRQDNLPRKVCPNCLYQLRQAILFKKKCEHNHTIFNALLSKNQNTKQSIVEYVIFKHYLPNKKATSDKPKTQNTVPIKQEVFETSVDAETSCYAESSCNIETSVDAETSCNAEPSCNIETSVHVEELVDAETSMCDATYDSEAEKAMIKMENLYKLRRKIRRMRNDEWRQKYVEWRENIKKSVKKVSKSYKCEICQKVLANKFSYQKHKIRHDGGRQYMCEHCGKLSVTKAELDVHTVHSHGTGRSLQCPTCSFKTAQRFILIEHQRLHTGERPFTCDKCGLTFRRRYIWKKHLLFHEEKKIQCTQCPRKFFRKEDLSMHCNNIHQRRYLFECVYCGICYARGTTMRKHYINKHNIKREDQGRLKKVNVPSNNQPAGAMEE